MSKDNSSIEKASEKAPDKESVAAEIGDPEYLADQFKELLTSQQNKPAEAVVPTNAVKAVESKVCTIS